VVKEVAELRSSVSDMAEKLRKRSEYLTAFASGVSHEFKTPLAAIKGAMEIIGEHGSDMDPFVLQKFQNNIKQDLDRLERLVFRLLSLARAEAVRPTGVERTEAISLIRELAERTMEKNPGFSVILETESKKLELALEPDVLETVILNLLDNSRESGAGKVIIFAGNDNKVGFLEIKDDGPGILEEDVDKIFTPFYTSRRSSGGTGLGLSLARTLLGSYRGKLELVARPAVFKITVPLVLLSVPQST
jgi:signal transduction histidine kinase